ncbi:MAG: redox-sensing transcriptional repressor Rex [Gemmatimonadota bacterium]
MTTLSRRVLERLMRYLRYVDQTAAREPITRIPSTQIAAALEIDATQVRKDFAAIGLVGSGRVGFDVWEVRYAIRAVLGFDRRNEAVLIGAGHLGGALLAYTGFATYGLYIVAAFDNDAARVGTPLGGCTVRAMKGLVPFIRTRMVPMAIITTPVAAAQEVADQVIHAGIRAIWNFAGAEIAVPPGVVVRQEHISLGLAELGYHLGRQGPVLHGVRPS